MVPAMDTFTKSSPALSQTSEGEDRGRKREKMKRVKIMMGRGKRETAQADDFSK